MSLITAMSHALTGLRTTEAGLDTVARNIAGAGVSGYARRRVTPLELGQGGVVASDVQRLLDKTVQRQLRGENSALGHAGVAAEYLSRLDTAFGAPGSRGSLDTLYNGLTAALQTLESEPGSNAARAGVINAARAVAGGLNTLSQQVQTLRTDSESAMSERVDAANAALQVIERIDHQLSGIPGGHPRADLLDERDRAIDALSKLIDIRVTSRGGEKIAIHTSGGAALFTGHAARLTFEPKGPLGPASALSDDPGQSTVAELGLVDAEGGFTRLQPGLIRGGEIAGLMALRDETLPSVQTALDQLAAGLATVTAGAGVALFVDAGNGSAAQPYVGGAQEVGFSARIAVDPLLARDPTPLTPDGAPGVTTGLIAALAGANITVRAPTPDGLPFTGTVGAALRNVIDRQAGQAGEATSFRDGQSVVVSALNERFARSSGVTVDEEMAQLVDLQNAYAANARVVSVVRDMFDALMRI